MTIRTMMLSALLLTTTACGTLDYALSPQKFDMARREPGDAIVVVSGGAARKCVSAATSLTLAPAGAPYAQDGIIGVNVDSYVFKSDYPDHHGTLSVFRLQPGQYQLYPYVQNPYVAVSRRPKAEFVANAGEVLYLGEFYAVQACGPGESRIEIRDMERRDISLLKARNPAFESLPIVKRLATFNGTVGAGE